jgi:hypothetical protein
MQGIPTALIAVARRAVEPSLPLITKLIDDNPAYKDVHLVMIADPLGSATFGRPMILHTQNFGNVASGGHDLGRVAHVKAQSLWEADRPSSEGRVSETSWLTQELETLVGGHVLGEIGTGRLIVAVSGFPTDTCNTLASWIANSFKLFCRRENDNLPEDCHFLASLGSAEVVQAG